MKKLGATVSLVLLIIIVSGSIFYWFQLRPSKIRKECMIMSQKGIHLNDNPSDTSFVSNVDKYRAQQGYLSAERINELYSQCLIMSGLNK